ncbi:MAG: hypothetical protein IRZ28_20100 [Steroidobacteraceae bacterium]|nr:hypothetical protein [Steroidobacteraceae bacterium]
MTAKKSVSSESAGVVLDRREFLAGAGFTAGAVVATSLVPMALVHAVPASAHESAAASEGTWHVDDMWGHWPPYSHPIPYGRPAAAPSLAELVDPVDRNFVV